MPTIIKSVTYTDRFGNFDQTYKANAGDLMSVNVQIGLQTMIMSSQSNLITYSALTKEVTITEGSWYDEGFRVGDVVKFEGVNENNSGTGVVYLTITSMPTDKVIQVTGLPNKNNETPPDKHIWLFSTTNIPNEIELSLNFIPSSNPTTEPEMESFIDGEQSRLILSNLNSIPIGVPPSVPYSIPIQVGKKSGNFSFQNVIAYRSNDDVFASEPQKVINIQFEFRNPNLFDESAFIGSECLKPVFKIISRKNIGDNKGQIVYYTKDASTGFLNEGFNGAISDVSYFPQQEQLYYNKINTFSKIIEFKSSVPNKYFLSGFYIPTDDNFNHNKQQGQEAFTAPCEIEFTSASTFPITAFGTLDSGEEYKIKIISATISTIGSIKSMDISYEVDFLYDKLKLNPQFGNFIEDRGQGDRLFYLFLKIGNTNVALFGNQLEYQIPIGVPFSVDKRLIINHDNNYNYDTTNNAQFLADSSCYDVNTEDDIAEVSQFTLDLFDFIKLDAVNYYILAENIATGKEFVLESMNFDTSSQDLNFFVDMYQNVSNNLPTSSLKKIAFLKLINKTNDIITLRLYYPFLIRWEYWLQQLNADQKAIQLAINNKDWNNYATNYDLTSTNNYRLKTKIGLVKDGIEDYSYYNQLYVNDYNYTQDVTSTIELIDLDTNLPSDYIIQGKKYKIKATHYNINGNWDFPNCYGQITIEEKESQPRLIVSSEIDADLLNNPLIPNQNRRMNMTLFNPKTIIMDCELNSDILTGNDYCITSKVSPNGQQNNPIFEVKVTSEDAEDKLTNSGEQKQLSTI